MSVHTYLDASTSYITAEDDRRLTEIAANGETSSPLRVIAHAYGYWILEHAHEQDSDDARRQRRADVAMSEAFWRLMNEARERGCTWVNLDSDGDDDLELPTHEW
jgi:hypothetical protein